MRITTILTVASVFAAPAAMAATAPISAADSTAIKAMLTKLYNAYVPNGTPPSSDLAFTPATRALIKENQRGADGVVASNEGDPICDCQDWTGIKVQTIALTPRGDGRVLAKVAFLDGKMRRSVSLIMEKVGGKWLVYDALRAGPSYRTAIIAENKQKK